ncbi:esterase-like activity of phytase family protein [Rhodococcus oryzae]|uniref:Esterase-like activity of phytase family protein n=1 Tax=Rhodococcus oryzae TaxID=2571143 RepID=A0ABY2REN2_9NOCA|nr:esterase-like activity of phytase family protein [Rhodococcus oryzae]TJZ74379.1 esterase-like activity of phytase family protein [Rhodococcus oryzae]
MPKVGRQADHGRLHGPGGHDRRSRGHHRHRRKRDALAQDGPAISDQVGSSSRVLRLDRATGANFGEFVYEVDPVRLAPGEAFNPVSSANGIGEILAISDSDYLTVERNVSAAGGLSVKLYRTSIHGAENVAGKATLTGTERKMRKALVFDFASTC